MSDRRLALQRDTYGPKMSAMIDDPNLSMEATESAYHALDLMFEDVAHGVWKDMRRPLFYGLRQMQCHAAAVEKLCDLGRKR